MVKTTFVWASFLEENLKLHIYIYQMFHVFECGKPLSPNVQSIFPMLPWWMCFMFRTKFREAEEYS
jgi:hypothetical protein